MSDLRPPTPSSLRPLRPPAQLLTFGQFKDQISLRPARTQLIGQASHPVLGEPATPLGHRRHNVFAERSPAGLAAPGRNGGCVRSRLRPGGTPVVSQLDRMGRDMREIMEAAWSLRQDLGARLEILSGPLAGVYDPRGMGKIFFAMLAGFAEMEREMMIERTNDDLAQVAAEGRSGDRRRTSAVNSASSSLSSGN